MIYSVYDQWPNVKSFTNLEDAKKYYIKVLRMDEEGRSAYFEQNNRDRDYKYVDINWTQDSVSGNWYIKGEKNLFTIQENVLD